jgi:hypothetical protein
MWMGWAEGAPRKVLHPISVSVLSRALRLLTTTLYANIWIFPIVFYIKLYR